MSADRDTMTTYRMADGLPILGEYDHVTDLGEWFDPANIDEPVELIHEEWALLSRETITIRPSWELTDEERNE